MIKNLAGTIFIRNGVSLDYCFEAAINSIKSFCDHVFVCYVESDDGTFDVLNSLLDERMTILKCTDEQWQEQQGRQKLSFFTNVAIEYAQSQGYGYQFNIQGDEVLDQDSIPYIQQAIEIGEEGYYVTRHNMWADTEHMLNVPQSRKPVSTQVGRLTKTGYRSVDDAESCLAPCSLDFINLIQIWHMGFIRDNKKHIAKIKEMQGNIFLMDYDKRADLKPEFDWKDWGFTDADLIPIHKPLPKYLDSWIENLNK